MAPIRVFISYSWGSTHVDRVVALASQLRASGIDARIDHFEPGPVEAWTQWMEQQIVRSRYVVLACCTSMQERFEGRVELNAQQGAISGRTESEGTGVAYEALLLRQQILESHARNHKVLPVLWDDALVSEVVPLILRPFSYYRLPVEYEDLLRRINGVPKYATPPLGDPPELSPIVIPPLGESGEQ